MDGASLETVAHRRCRKESTTRSSRTRPRSTLPAGQGVSLLRRRDAGPRPPRDRSAAASTLATDHWRSEAVTLFEPPVRHALHSATSGPNILTSPVALSCAVEVTGVVMGREGPNLPIEAVDVKLPSSQAGMVGGER